MCVIRIFSRGAERSGGLWLFATTKAAIVCCSLLARRGTHQSRSWLEPIAVHVGDDKHHQYYDIECSVPPLEELAVNVARNRYAVATCTVSRSSLSEFSPN